jgi:hypothetical protein
MSTPDNPDPVDFGVDEDDAAIDEALEALTSGMSLTATAEENEALGEDTVGEAEDDEDDEDDDGADDAADDLIGALEVPMAGDAPINFAEPGEDQMEPMPVDDLHAMPITVALPEAAMATGRDQRLAQLEQLASALVEAENTREGQRVKRKVKASATGAAGAGLLPVVLMLTGAFDLDPELAATLAAGVAALASFLTGYFTPERQPALDPVVAHKVKTPRRRRQ